VAEAALERQFWTGASIVVTLRHLRFDDVVDQLLLPEFGGAAAVGNIGDGRQTDIATTLTLPLKRVGLTGMNLKATVTRRWSEVIDPTTKLGRLFSGQPPWSGELHFSHDIPTWKITWGIDAFYNDANILYRPTYTQGVGPWTRVNAFVEYRLKRDLNLRVEGVNLNDPRPRWIVKTFTGPRGSAPLLYTERRRLGDGPYLLVRLRKDLG
jgi:outer membrane receptor protein involved in Fe transport